MGQCNSMNSSDSGAGLGFGQLRHQENSNEDTDNQKEEHEGDLQMQLAVVGFEQQLSSIGAWDFSLAGDLGLIKTSSQWPDRSGLDDLSITLTRSRLGVDSSFPISERTRGYLSLRGRLDGGELQMGAAEMLLGLRYNTGRFSAVLQGRQTYAFDGSYSESGILGELRFSPQQDGTGIAFQLQPSYGAVGSEQASLTNDQQLQHLSGWNGDGQSGGTMALKTTIGYGVLLPDSHLLLTPFAEVAFTKASNQQIGLGISMEGSSWQVKLSGSREVGSSTAPHDTLKPMFSKQL